MAKHTIKDGFSTHVSFITHTELMTQLKAPHPSVTWLSTKPNLLSLSNVVSQITPCLINIRVLTENQQARGTWKPLQDCKILRENKVLLLHCSKEQLLNIRNIYKNLSQLASQIGVCGFLGGHQCRKR